MSCGIWPIIALYGMMCVSFVVLWTGPLWFFDRSERRLERRREEGEQS